MKTMRIAMPKGRLMDSAMAFFARAGLAPEGKLDIGRRLVGSPSEQRDIGAIQSRLEIIPIGVEFQRFGHDAVGIGDETVRILHRNVFEILVTQLKVLGHQIFCLDNVGDDRIDLIIRQGARIAIRHRPLDVVKGGAQMWPVRAYGLERIVMIKRPCPACQLGPVSDTFGKITVADRALLGKNFFANNRVP